MADDRFDATADHFLHQHAVDARIGLVRLGILQDLVVRRGNTRSIGHAQPLPGVRDWLARLQAAGARQAVASSAPQANIDALIDALGLRGSL